MDELSGIMFIVYVLGILLIMSIGAVMEMDYRGLNCQMGPVYVSAILWPAVLACVIITCAMEIFDA